MKVIVKLVEYFVDLNYRQAVVNGDIIKMKRMMKKYPRESYVKYLELALAHGRHEICKILYRLETVFTPDYYPESRILYNEVDFHGHECDYDSLYSEIEFEKN